MPVDDDTIYDKDGDEELLTDTRTFRRELLRGQRKMQTSQEKHTIYLEGNTDSEPTKPGLIRQVETLEKREKFKDKILGLIGFSALSALCLTMWEFLKTKFGAK